MSHSNDKERGMVAKDIRKRILRRHPDLNLTLRVWDWGKYNSGFQVLCDDPALPEIVVTATIRLCCDVHRIGDSIKFFREIDEALTKYGYL